jgi:RecB family endonuclease NucS
VGAPLLVLSRQLAEFSEHHDKLDVLALDEDGEIVIIELRSRRASA